MTIRTPEQDFASPEVAADLGEPYMLGQVIAREKSDAAMLGIPRAHRPEAVYSVTVADPHLARFTTAELTQVQQVQTRTAQIAARRREQGLWQRRVGTAYVDDDGQHHATKGSWGDPVAGGAWFDQAIDNPGIHAWRRMIPSAASLAVLCDAGAGHDARDEHGHAVALDRDAQKWLMLVTDAIAVRSRGTVMAEIVTRLAVAALPGEQFHWLSIASGTALPAMKAAVAGGLTPSLHLVDFDRAAMSSARAVGAQIGFSGHITTTVANIFNAERMHRLGASLAAAGAAPHLIDMMGIFEYTGAELGVDPVDFLASAYAMLRPCGTLILGQMRSDRPVPDFTLGVIGWPHITMRSLAELMEVVAGAGIDPGQVVLTLPEDGVYAIAAIRKPPVGDPDVIVLP